jgi:hypothetical protein
VIVRVVDRYFELVGVGRDGSEEYSDIGYCATGGGGSSGGWAVVFGETQRRASRFLMLDLE